MEYVDCVVDPDYEIAVAYPYPIRRKNNGRSVTEYVETNGYIRCYLNCQKYLKHRIVALQFVPNDDPEHKTQVDHIDHDRSNNWINNLHWVTPSENSRNFGSMRGVQYTFHDELPETAESLDAYNGHEFDGLFVDYDEQKLYLFNGVRYRELVSTRDRGNLYYRVYDITNKQRKLSHKILFG